MSVYQQYSHHARRALSHASNLAKRYQHEHLSTAHLLVGVILSEGSVGAQVMQELDLPAAVAEVYLKRLMPPIGPQTGPLLRDSTFDKALEESEEESAWLGTPYVGTEHLLLGITRTNLGNAITLLRLLDIAPEQVRRRVRSAITDGQQESNLQSVRSHARLSEISKRVLNAAEQFAVAMDHPTVGLGHLLLALVRERRGVTAGFLIQSGLSADQVVAGLNRRDTVPLISVEDILFEAIRLSEKVGSHYVGADHLLMAFATHPGGVSLLQYYHVDPDKVARLLTKYLRD